MSERTYGALPDVIGAPVEIDCPELMFVQYMPIKLAGQVHVSSEPRIACFSDTIGTALCDYIGLRGLDSFRDSYVYITTKHMFQAPGCSFNRPGWHSDGFLTDDINYVWCNVVPTVFNDSHFKLTPDDEVSMEEMEYQAASFRDTTYPVNTLLRLDQFVIHRVGIIDRLVLRTFLKVSISRDRYDLKGNAHNYQLDYDWSMRERALVRNVPQVLTKEKL